VPPRRHSARALPRVGHPGPEREPAPRPPRGVRHGHRDRRHERDGGALGVRPRHGGPAREERGPRGHGDPAPHVHRSARSAAAGGHGRRPGAGPPRLDPGGGGGGVHPGAVRLASGSGAGGGRLAATSPRHDRPPRHRGPAPPPPPPSRRDTAAADTTPLRKLLRQRPVPYDRLVVRTAAALAPGGTYLVRVRGATNLTGAAADAQGVVTVPAPKPAPRDSTRPP